MRMTALAFACLLLCSVSDCQATPQDSATQPPKPSLVLREGVGVYLNFAQTVTKKTARDGEPAELVLAQDLNVGDTVVAAAGSRAVGVVVRKDEFQVRPTWLQAGRTKVPLRGSLNIPEEIYTAASRSQGPDRVYVAADTELPWSSQPVSTVGKDASAVADIPANKILLPSGKTVRLVLMQSISSKTVKVGDSVKFQVLDAVKVDNLVVIANKAPAAATINASHPAARAWRAGGVEMRMDFVTLVDHQKQPLQALTASKGAATNAGADWAACIGQVFGCILFLPFAPLQHGNQAILPKGQVLTAMTNGDSLLDRSVVEASQPAAPEKRHGDATVTVYNLGISHAFTVWCGVVKLGRVPEGHKFSLHLAPGKYAFRLEQKGAPRWLEAEDGGEYYLERIA